MSSCNIKMPKNGLYMTDKDFINFQDFFGEIMSDEISAETGESIDGEVLVQNVTFVVTERCNLRCSYCFSGDTLVTMADFSKKRIKDVKIGDEVLAFNEFSEEKSKHDVSEIATVEQLFHREEKTVKITFEDGTFLNATENHPILYRRNSNDSLSDYKKAGKFRAGQYVYFAPDVSEAVADTESRNYQIGYFIAMMQGDGSCKKYVDKNGYDMYKIRLAVKDDEIIERTSKIMKNLGINHYLAEYEVSKKFGLKKDAIFANTKRVYDSILNLIEENFLLNKDPEYFKGYLAGIYDAEGHIERKKGTIRITNTDENIIKEIENGMESMGISYVIEKTGKTINNLNKFCVRVLSKKKSFENLRFVKGVCPAVKRKGVENFYGKCVFSRKKVVSVEKSDEVLDVFNLGTTSRTYVANNILVHNCYEDHEIHKCGQRMTKEVAKEAVDLLFDKEKINGYFDHKIKKGIILEFIGGEPLLEIDLIDYIVDYFKLKALEYDHPWCTNYMCSMTSNGVMYLNEKVNKFIKKNKNRVAITLTIDGNKDLHDSCRVFPDGRGSYDVVEKSVQKWVSDISSACTKLTLAPDNIEYLHKAVINLWNLKIKGVHANPVFEKGWSIRDAKTYYKQLSLLADEMLENELYTQNFVSLFDESIGKKRSNNRNWCGGNGEMLCFAPDGRAFPCLRFMQHSLKNYPEQPIGSIEKLESKENNKWLKNLCSVTMSSQSSGDCTNCPIETGCALCTGYNYDEFGTPNKRATFICDMHRARVLANCYYWNSLYKKLGLKNRFELNIEASHALKIIDENELSKLKKMSR